MKLSKGQIIDLTILALRWYLAFYMIDYGIAKISGDQFGVVNPKIVEMPMKEINPFYIAWYLFSLSRFFNIAIGIIQIVGGLLIIINRTVVIGALFLFPVLCQICLIDGAFTTHMFGYNLVFRLGAMIFSDIVILYYYRSKISAAWSLLTGEITGGIKFKWWVYLLLPMIGFLMDFVLRIFTWPLQKLIEQLIR